MSKEMSKEEIMKHFKDAEERAMAKIKKRAEELRNDKEFQAELAEEINNA